MVAYSKTSCPYCKAVIQDWTQYADSGIGPPREKCKSCGKIYSTGRNFYCKMTSSQKTSWAISTFFTYAYTTFLYSIGSVGLFSWICYEVLKYVGMSIEFETGFFLVLLLFIVTAIFIGTLFYKSFVALKNITPENYSSDETSTERIEKKSFEQFDKLATSILQMIDQMLIDRRIVESMIDTYSDFCRGDEARRLRISKVPVTKETHLRIRFECLCYCINAVSILAAIFLKDNKTVSVSSNSQEYNPFDGAVGVAFLELCDRTGMNHLCEIIASIDNPNFPERPTEFSDVNLPHITCGLGDYIDPLDRLNEYRSAFLRLDNENRDNAPIEIFGKRIGKILDADHYIFFVEVGMKAGSQLREISEIVIASNLSK